MATKNKKEVEQVVSPVAPETGSEPQTDETKTKKPKLQLNRYQVISIVCASLLVAMALGVGIYFIVKHANENPPYNPPPLEAVLTEENYNKISVGMTYAEVFEILGEGKRSSSNEIGQLNYTWEDNNGNYIVLVFTATAAPEGNNGWVPGIVISKAQIGILD